MIFSGAKITSAWGHWPYSSNCAQACLSYLSRQGMQFGRHQWATWMWRHVWYCKTNTVLTKFALFTCTPRYCILLLDTRTRPIWRHVGIRNRIFVCTTQRTCFCLFGRDIYEDNSFAICICRHWGSLMSVDGFWKGKKIHPHSFSLQSLLRHPRPTPGLQKTPMSLNF